MQHITENIVISTAYRRLTVGAYATGKGLVCVDVPPMPIDALRWRSLIESRFKQPVRLIILTDANHDRLPGLHWFADVPIIAHEYAVQTIAQLPHKTIDKLADQLSQDSAEHSAFAGVKLRLPQIAFDQRATAYIDDVPVTIQAMPGPTPGNIWFHLPQEKVVFTGDSVVVDSPIMMNQPDSAGWLDSLATLRRARFIADAIVPGRGPATDKSATESISTFLRYLRRRVQHFCQADRPLEELIDFIPEVLDRMPYPCPEDDVERTSMRLLAGLEAMCKTYRLENKPDTKE